MARFDNESGIAHGIFQIGLYFGAAAIVWLVLAESTNSLITIYVDPQIADGAISMQSFSTITFCINVLRYAVPVILTGGFLWIIQRAIWKKEGGN